MTARSGERDHDRVQHILDAADKLAEIVAEGRAAYEIVRGGFSAEQRLPGLS